MALKPLIAGMSQDTSGGAAGYTVPVGGLETEVLAKASNADGDFAWAVRGITYTGEWSVTPTYLSGSLVTYLGSLYIANSTVAPGDSPETSNLWYVLAPPNISFYLPGLIVDEALLGTRTMTKSFRIYGFDLSVVNASTGASIIVDLEINGVLQGNNTILPAGETYAQNIFGTEEFIQYGQTVGVRVRQVGSVFAGQYLTVDFIT